MRGAGRGRGSGSREQHHGFALRACQREPARRGEVEQRLTPVQLEQHRRRGAVAHAVEPGAQQRLAVGQREQRHCVGIDAQFGKARAIGLARGIILTRPDQRPPVEIPPQPCDQQGEAHRAGDVDLFGSVEFVQPVGAQTAAERAVQPCLAERHEPCGRRRRLPGGGKGRIESHLFMICSF